MNIIEKSLKIALIAHSNQKDKANEEYILHPLRLMSKVKKNSQKVVAILHDVIEDSDFTKDDLLKEGFSKEIVDAIVTLTKIDGESYDTFIDRVLKNKLATIVKKVDIEDNINILRLTSLTNKDFERIKKYHNAWNILNKSLNENKNS